MAGLETELNGGIGRGLRLQIGVERWPLASAFTISRGSKREAVVVVVTLSDGAHTGRGECVPYARYGESVESAVAAIEGCAEAIARGLSREELALLLPAGAARNALDCALWDLEAKQRGTTVAGLRGLAPPRPATTAFTISLDTPEAMAARAAEARDFPLLKIKLGGEGDAARIAAIRLAVPQARLIADANEAWQVDETESLLSLAAASGIELVEQPLHAGSDDILAEMRKPVPVCADESVHDRASLSGLIGRYDAVNIKLDKTGGLTEALCVAQAARALGLKLMVGSMVATSLAIAPALILAQDADWVDLDGPLLLANDRVPGLRYEGATIFPPEPALWG
jgi:L-alanine-DL-glutamate epimerase-like enolase superfamily enzyme